MSDATGTAETAGASVQLRDAAYYARQIQASRAERDATADSRETEFNERMRAACLLFNRELKAKIHERLESMEERGNYSSFLNTGWSMNECFPGTSFKLSTLVYGFLQRDEMHKRGNRRRNNYYEERDVQWNTEIFTKLEMIGTAFDVVKAECEEQGIIITDEFDISKGVKFIIGIEIPSDAAEYEYRK